MPKRVLGSRSKYIRAGEIKYFSDLLGPLRRFLRKNVGRPWNQANQPLPSYSIPEISDSPLLLLRKKQLNQKELKTAKLKNDHPLACPQVLSTSLRTSHGR